jgi:hypothetical protein
MLIPDTKYNFVADVDMMCSYTAKEHSLNEKIKNLTQKDYITILQPLSTVTVM